MTLNACYNETENVYLLDLCIFMPAPVDDVMERIEQTAAFA